MQPPGIVGWPWQLLLRRWRQCSGGAMREAGLARARDLDIGPVSSYGYTRGRWKVEVATKFAISFADGKVEICGDPVYVRACHEGSLSSIPASIASISTRSRCKKGLHEMSRLPCCEISITKSRDGRVPCAAAP
uniref:Uncharacterized protein n=1 Tax=Oryza punctata TaxID=4537 RepID=A0A0E0KP44_ORYPU